MPAALLSNLGTASSLPPTLSSTPLKLPTTLPVANPARAVMPPVALEAGDLRVSLIMFPISGARRMKPKAIRTPKLSAILGLPIRGGRKTFSPGLFISGLRAKMLARMSNNATAGKKASCARMLLTQPANENELPGMRPRRIINGPKIMSMIMKMYALSMLNQTLKSATKMATKAIRKPAIAIRYLRMLKKAILIQFSASPSPNIFPTNGRSMPNPQSPRSSSSPKTTIPPLAIMSPKVAPTFMARPDMPSIVPWQPVSSPRILVVKPIGLFRRSRVTTEVSVFSSISLLTLQLGWDSVRTLTPK